METNKHKSTKVNAINYNADYHVVGKRLKSKSKIKLVLTTIIWSSIVGLVLWSIYIVFSYVSELSEPSLPPLNLNQTVAKSSPLVQLRYYVGSNENLAPKNLTDQFLTNYLDVRQNDVQKSYDSIQTYFRLRQDRPDLFMNATEGASFVQPQIYYYQKEMTANNESILYVKLANWKYETQNYAKAMATCVPFAEIKVINGASQQPPPITILDMSDWTFSHMISASPSDLRLAHEVTERSFPVPTGKIHIVHQNWFAEQTFRLSRLLMSDDTTDNIFYHGDNLSELYKSVPKNILPTPVGGDVPLRIWTKQELDKFDLILEKYRNQFLV